MTLSITADQGTITATWTAVPGSNGYRISNGPTTVDLPSAVLSYTFSGLASNTLYAITLKSLVYDGGETQSIVTPAPPVVVQPSNPNQVKIGSATRLLAGTNVGRGLNELIRYTRTTTQTATPTNQYGVEVTINETTNKVTFINNRLASGSTAGTAIPAGSYVLSGHGVGAGYAGTWLLDNAVFGATVELVDTTGGGGVVVPPVNPSTRRVPLVGNSGLPFNLTYFGPNQPAAVSWLGRPLDGAMNFAWVYGWADANNSLAYDKTVAFGPTWNNGIKIVTMSTILNSDANLSTAASGGNNQRYRDFANALKAAGYGKADKTTVVRLNHEFNGGWYKWRLNNPNPAAFVSSFRHFVTEVKAILPDVLFNWCPTRGSTGSGNWTDGYPGDDYVDIIGIDTYDYYPAVINDTTWAPHVNSTPGMGEVVAMANSKGKQWAIDEWGITWDANGGNDNPAYIQRMYDYVIANKANLAYMTWYNDPGAPATFNHQLYPTTKSPNSSAKFKQLFGQ